MPQKKNAVQNIYKIRGRQAVTFTSETKPIDAMDELYYKDLARLLVSRIGDRHYFNGTVECGCGDSGGVLKTALIIYRAPLLDPADKTGAATGITDIVPVWWEFSACDAEGPVRDDFSWSEFRPYLLGAC